MTILELRHHSFQTPGRSMGRNPLLFLIESRKKGRESCTKRIPLQIWLKDLWASPREMSLPQTDEIPNPSWDSLAIRAQEYNGYIRLGPESLQETISSALNFSLFVPPLTLVISSRIFFWWFHMVFYFLQMGPFCNTLSLSLPFPIPYTVSVPNR